MKLEKITHDHLLTKWLKVIIFAILMLAPIFSVAIRCAYVVCNKNAYQSYSATASVENLNGANEYTPTTLSTNWVALTNNGVEGYSSLNYTQAKKFNFRYNDVIFAIWQVDENTTTGRTNFYGNQSTTYQSNISNQTKTINGHTYLFNNLTINYDTEYTQVYLFGNGTPFNGTFKNVGFIRLNEYFNVIPTPLSMFNKLYNELNNFFVNGIANIETDKPQPLDNVFDYSVAQLKQDQLFNWTQNTGVYTGVNAMTTGLGLTDGTIAILITYWTLLSIIYVIIDIVLEGFVTLTHMILKKAS